MENNQQTQEIEIASDGSQNPPAKHNPASTEIDSISNGESATEEITNPMIPFREAKISVAVDTSGSTYGTGLKAEKAAIREIFSLLPPTIKSSTKILPWSDRLKKIVGIDQLDSLSSNGGTDPNVLLSNDASRYELQNCSFWFLMTDGEIFDHEVHKFAKSLLEYGLHGLACVVSVFGDRRQLPAKCNISVGLSVFAVSPHCLFLYTDERTSETFILQTKGIFSALLPEGTEPPTLLTQTRWEDLPQTSYEDFSRIQIPPSQTVSKNDVILSDNTRINISELLEKTSLTIMGQRIRTLNPLNTIQKLSEYRHKKNTESVH
ncbi:hypothetical protein H072_11388 [Dactylellina haptotyla CBS 200.50]|uniref:VWFA domain-containing protein n=1 Tax=Dactylellina haptotyla (strain CBS 200.50) TaxID=1284197 RepID=S7ZWS9_DACHA|nr:hypothetical protein H072_11388 [Dactylellina haptotyla CBS 200.50]